MIGRIEHNCKECEGYIQQVLDGACNAQQENYFVQEINQCPRCADKYQQEQSFRVFLQNKLPKKSCSKTLLSNIMSGIRNEEKNVRTSHL